MTTYTITSASYANAEHTAAVIMTREAAAVLVSERDTPDLWKAMLAWGAPQTYTPAAPSPEPVAPAAKLAAFLNANPDVKAMLG